jgi:hypothetical protein
MLAAGCLSGCKQGSESDLSKDERQKMDTLFREGVKHPPTPAGETKESKPINAPTD